MPTRSSRATACSTLSGVRSLPRRLGKRSRSTSRSSALCSARSASRRKHRGTSSESTATSSTSTASRRSSSKRKETDPEAASAKLHEALALWRGRPLEEFAYEGFAQVEIARLEELRLACLEERVDADLACGRHSELVGELEALVAEHPHRELRIRRRGASSSRGSGSSLEDHCASSSTRSCSRIPRSTSSRRRPRRRTRREESSSGASRSSKSSAPVSTQPSPAAAACSCSRVSRASARAASRTK